MNTPTKTPDTPPTQPTSQTPTPAPLPPLTTWQKIKYSLFALFFIGAVGFAIFWNVSSNNADNDLKDNGVRATGTANGDAHAFTDRSRRSSTTRYKVIYDYSYPLKERNGRLAESIAIGEKVYDTEEEVRALKGKTADVYYDPDDAGKGTFVTNEP